MCKFNERVMILAMKEKNINTKLAHTGDIELSKKLANSVSVPKVLPIYMSSVFSFDDVPTLDAVYAGEADGYVYSRMSNPGTDAVEMALASIEGDKAAGALVFSSGMAAIINSIIANVQAGDHIVSSPVLYGGVYDYLKNELARFNVECTFVDFKDDLDALKAAIRPNTKVIYTETITNPLMEVMDLPGIAEIAHEHGCKFIVDNTFATAAVCSPWTSAPTSLSTPPPSIWAATATSSAALPLPALRIWPRSSAASLCTAPSWVPSRPGCC